MLEIRHLTLSFNSFTLGPLDLDVNAGEHLVVLGPSGSGKSLLLELIAGFQKPKSGQILLNGKDIKSYPPHKRSVGFVFQRPALFQHLSVFQNILFPLKSKGFKRKELDEKVLRLASKFHLTELLHRMPAALSGGEAQRVSLARTLAKEPSILLLDEPLTSLDLHLRAEIRDYLDVLNQEGMTMMHVTHDVSEAFRVSRRVAVLRQGRIVQSGLIDEILKRPVDDFIAKLLGIRNYYPVEVVHSNQTELTHVLYKKIIIKLLAQPIGKKGFIRIDEQQIVLSATMVQLSAQNILQGRVVKLIPMYNSVLVELDVGFQLFAQVSSEAISILNIAEGSNVFAIFKLAAVHFQE